MIGGLGGVSESVPLRAALSSSGQSGVSRTREFQPLANMEQPLANMDLTTVFIRASETPPLTILVQGDGQDHVKQKAVEESLITLMNMWRIYKIHTHQIPASWQMVIQFN